MLNNLKRITKFPTLTVVKYAEIGGVSGWKDAALFRSEVDSFTPQVVFLDLDVDRVGDLDGQFAGMTRNEAVTAAVRRVNLVEIKLQ